MALNKKQKILLDLLVRAEKIMRENDIDFFLFGGSTIGALRHDGFIPWDDDIDIIIDAENYYKLQKLFENGPIDNIDLVYFHNDPYWYRAYAMLVNLTDTCYSRPVMYTTGKNAGTRIDTMICDYVPTARLEEYKHDLMLYQDVLMESAILDNAIHTIKDEYLALKERQKQIGKLALEKEMREKLESYSTPDADQMVVRYSTRKMRHYDRDTIYDPLYHDFEGYPMPIPAKPEKQLRAQYGYDWYIIPGQDAYATHMFFNNYEISGNNYHDDIKRFYDRDALEDAARERKIIRIERRRYVEESNNFRNNILAQRELMRVDIRGREAQLTKLAEDGNYKELFKEMLPLLNVSDAFEAVPKEHKIIPEIIMKGWLRACITGGKYYKAPRIISAFELSEDQFKEEFDLLNRVMDLAEAYQDNRTADIRDALKSFTDEELEIVPDCILSKARLLKDENGHFDKDSGSLLQLCDRYLEKEPKNYEVMKVKADILFDSGRIDEAMKLYETVHKHTSNGLDLMEIEKRFGFSSRFKGLSDEDEIDRMLREIL